MSKVITYSFTENFIDCLSEYLDKEYIQPGKTCLPAGRDLSRLAICFGGKRPALFIKRELAKRLGANFYPPRFFTIDEFMGDVVRRGGSRTAPTADLDGCYLLYKIAQEKCPAILKGRETFAEFLPWTREILAFIDQLDLESIDNDRLRNIESNAEIGYSVPADINKLLEHVVTLREGYHEALTKEQLTSRGLTYLKAAQMIKSVSFEEFDQIIFANFFYFNRSEEVVVHDLYKRDKATLIFQGDERKWPAFRRIAQTLECQILEGDEPFVPQFNLKLHSAFDAHSQVGIIREILHSTTNLDKTVIVLPNPDHIVPLIAEVAQVADDFNISMGYPLKRSSLYTLFQFIFKAQLSRKEGRYYAKDYLKVLSHPFIKNLKLSSHESVTRILVHKIEEILTGKEVADISGNLFVDLDEVIKLDALYEIVAPIYQRMDIDVHRDELKTIVEQLHNLLFVMWESINTVNAFADTLGVFLDTMVEKSFMHNYPLNNNIAIRMYDLKDELSQAAFKEEKFAQEDIFHMFDNKVSREIVAFIGSPLKGLQILGLFETRSLNFENVIVMDVNEGTLPHLNIYEPLIPREVMVSLGLDRLELEEEIQRYQFMRLISSAKNVHLVYQESKDKEKSRFVEELIWEEEKKQKQLNVVPYKRASFNVEVKFPVKQVRKTPEMIETLRNHKYSASSINTYLRNPMDFYYNYVLGLREQEDLLDEPEARHVGTFVHELLEENFSTFKNKKPKIDTQFRDKFFNSFHDHFSRRFGRSMRGDSFLLKNVIGERMGRFLDNEAQNEERQIDKILYLESRFEEVIDLPCGPVTFGYIVDRVDQLKDGTIMIIDYKTGSVDMMPQAVEKVETMELSRANIRDTIRSFQIPLYFHYLYNQFKGKPVNAALYNLRTLTMNKFITDTANVDYERINKAFLRPLGFIVEEILNPKIDFVEDTSLV